MKIKKIAEKLDGDLFGNGETEILRIASLDSAKTDEITFLENLKSTDKIKNLKASCLIVPKEFEGEFPFSFIKVKDPKLAFAKIAEILHPPKKRKPEIHVSAVIAENAKIGKDVFIGAFCCVGDNSLIGDGTQLRGGAKVGDNVKIGSDCVFNPNVFIEDNCTIGNRVILHAGVIIGADGFGYVRSENEHIKFPQIGTVVIENDVEIGANSCVDRGALGETRIGESTKIDNLVQVGHNVQIGKRVIIASQTGISGSVVIEDDCLIAGQVGFGEHAKVEKGAIIGGKSGIFSGKIVRKGFWSGIPVQPIDEYKRQIIWIKSIGKMREEIKELKKKISDLNRNSD